MTEQIGKVSVGQAEVVELLLALVSRGHLLLVGLARTLRLSPVSQVLHLSFKRTQFLPEKLEKSPAG